MTETKNRFQLKAGLLTDEQLRAFVNERLSD